MPDVIPASTVVLYMRVTGLTVGDVHWPVTGRGEFVHETPALPLPAPGGSWRDLVADGHNVAADVSFFFAPDSEQPDLVQAIMAAERVLLWAGGFTLYDARPVSVMLTGYHLDVCRPDALRWSATHLPDDPFVVRFGEMNHADAAES